MKSGQTLILLALFAVLGSSCVSRTTTKKSGHGNDSSEKKTLWIWQEEYRNSK